MLVILECPEELQYALIYPKLSDVLDFLAWLETSSELFLLAQLLAVLECAKRLQDFPNYPGWLKAALGILMYLNATLS